MRTIKFRGKRKYNGKWIYGSLIYFKESYYIQESGEGESFVYPMNVEVISETVGQFTEIYDKDGVEIYAGDIVNVKAGEYCQGVWEWDGIVAIEDIRLAYQDIENADTIEVIGNIHDNPELMERIRT